LGAIGLLDIALCDGTIIHRSFVEQFAELAVFFRMRGIIVVKPDIESRKIPDVLGVHALNQLLGLNTLSPGTNHNRCTVCIVGTEIQALIPSGLLEPDPDVGLQIFHQMTDMYGTVGVR
jgi:hypothetical protein